MRVAYEVKVFVCRVLTKWRPYKLVMEPLLTQCSYFFHFPKLLLHMQSDKGVAFICCMYMILLILTKQFWKI